MRVVGLTVPKNFLATLRTSRYLPIFGDPARFEAAAAACMQRFRALRCARLVLADGQDVSEGAYATIEKYIAHRCAQTLRDLECVLDYVDGDSIDLEVLISNVGGVHGVVDAVCTSRGVPSYLIINGWMSGDFLDEGKYATVINAYARSVKERYFRGMGNVVCLGDPRMDAYPPAGKRARDSSPFRVTIGASGYMNIDLNSYVAVEFDFMFDILSALARVRDGGVPLHVVIKVRPNGYAGQYRQFCSEYFPALVAEIIDDLPMKQVLERSDFYVSIYSQTIFEASCLGIPCVYYKKDTEILDPPFDGKSELVTAQSPAQLAQAISDWRSGSARFDAFLDRRVMENYIGPLDGRNLERNVDFVYDLLKRNQHPSAA